MNNINADLPKMLALLLIKALAEDPASNIQAKASAKNQPDVEIPSRSKLPSGFSFERIEADSRRGLAFVLYPTKVGKPMRRTTIEEDVVEREFKEDEDLDLSQLLAMGPVKAYLVPEAPVPADLAWKPQPNWPEKYESQIEIPSSSNPPSQTVNTRMLMTVKTRAAKRPLTFPGLDSLGSVVAVRGPSGSPIHRERETRFVEDREREKMQENATIKTFL